MTMRELASELMKNAKPETGFMLTTSILENNAEIELRNVSRVDTALFPGKART